MRNRGGATIPGPPTGIAAKASNETTGAIMPGGTRPKDGMARAGRQMPSLTREASPLSKRNQLCARIIARAARWPPLWLLSIPVEVEESVWVLAVAGINALPACPNANRFAPCAESPAPHHAEHPTPVTEITGRQATPLTCRQYRCARSLPRHGSSLTMPHQERKTRAQARVLPSTGP